MRAKNMQALTEDIDGVYPGVTIYGIGDKAHQLRPSDHNEDDTVGSKPAQTDADNNPEHRAIDVMIGPAMSKSKCRNLVDALATDPESRRRLYNIIHDGTLWSKNNGWIPVPFDGDPHTGHAHIAGRASDDENGAHWPVVIRLGDEMGTAETHMITASTYRDFAILANKEVIYFNIGDEPKKFLNPEDNQYYSRKEENGLYKQLKKLEEKISMPEIDYDKLAAALIKAGIATKADVDDVVDDSLADVLEAAASEARTQD